MLIKIYEKPLMNAKPVKIFSGVAFELDAKDKRLTLCYQEKQLTMLTFDRYDIKGNELCVYLKQKASNEY